MTRRRSPGSIHAARGPCAAFLVLVLAACGGGGSGASGVATQPPTTTPPDEGGATLTLESFTPSTLQANFNTPVTLRGSGFVAPVTVELLDGSGALLAPGRTAQVRDGGTRLQAESPLLPGLEGSEACRVRVRNGDGRAVALEGTVLVEHPLAELRSFDGSGNNVLDGAIGAVGTALRADVPRAYADGVSAPAGSERASARAVSNAVCQQDETIENQRGVSDMFWIWGQFLDHDIDLTPETEEEAFDILVPQGDPWFDPLDTGDVALGFHRSVWLEGTGTDAANPRLQPNVITSWIDASNVYGSDAERARALRMLDGSGRLRTSAGDLLPFNTDGLPNAPSASIPTYFVAGDVRANEQIGLTAMHTLFVREHNRIADDLRARNPHLTGDEVYEAARRWVGAEMQVITYREFLPLLLGAGALPARQGYDPSLDAGVGVLFSTACYRFGHSMVSGRVLRLDANGETIAEGDLSLRDAFFNPGLLVTEGGIEPLLRGFALQRAQELDPLVVDDLRNFLFGPPGAGGLDLPALNIQRGRDHGLPDYNTVCRVFGLTPRDTFDAVTDDAEYAAKLATAYADVDDMDVWVAALCEDPVNGGMVGRLLHTVFRDQFLRLRDGDRFWYQDLYRGEALQQLEATRLSDVIRRNSTIGGELPADVFLAPEAGERDRDRPLPRRDAAEVGALLQQNRFFR